MVTGGIIDAFFELVENRNNRAQAKKIQRVENCTTSEIERDLDAGVQAP